MPSCAIAFSSSRAAAVLAALDAAFAAAAMAASRTSWDTPWSRAALSRSRVSARTSGAAMSLQAASSQEALSSSLALLVAASCEGPSSKDAGFSLVFSSSMQGSAQPSLQAGPAAADPDDDTGDAAVFARGLGLSLESGM